MSDRSSTPSQTVGPFFHDALMRDGVDELDAEGVAGTPVVVTGRVIDGSGDPVTDAMLESWQADGGGRYRHPVDGRSSDVERSFIGWGRVATDQDGHFRIATVLPGTVPGREGTVQAPHLVVQIFARGLLDHLTTRIYFAGHPANDADPVLGAVPAGRRATLLATTGEPIDGVDRYHIDIVLQGANETVFFDV